MRCQGCGSNSNDDFELVPSDGISYSHDRPPDHLASRTRVQSIEGERHMRRNSTTRHSLPARMSYSCRVLAFLTLILLVWADEVAAGSCCVECGGHTVCACAVSTSCGSCCYGACCAGASGPPSVELKVGIGESGLDTLRAKQEETVTLEDGTGKRIKVTPLEIDISNGSVTLEVSEMTSFLGWSYYKRPKLFKFPDEDGYTGSKADIRIKSATVAESTAGGECDD